MTKVKHRSDFWTLKRRPIFHNQGRATECIYFMSVIILLKQIFFCNRSLVKCLRVGISHRLTAWGKWNWAMFSSMFYIHDISRSRKCIILEVGKVVNFAYVKPWSALETIYVCVYNNIFPSSTAQLSCHVQNLVVITLSDIGQEQN